MFIMLFAKNRKRKMKDTKNIQQLQKNSLSLAIQVSNSVLKDDDYKNQKIT